MEKLELHKPRRAVEISNTINLIQRKAFNCLMIQSMLIPKQKGEKYHKISIKELCHLTGYRQKDFLYLDKQLEEMQTTLIRWSGSKEGDYGRVQFLGAVEYKDGILHYSFSEMLMDLVKGNKLYNKLDMGSMRELTSKYSIALYELCSGYRETASFKDGTGWRVLGDLKYYLCGDQQVYPQFKEFNKFVLKPAMKEVNEHTDITVEMFTQKKGRSIHALKFLVKANENYEDILLERPIKEASTKLEFNENKPPVAQIAPDEMLRELSREEQKSLFGSQP